MALPRWADEAMTMAAAFWLFAAALKTVVLAGAAVTGSWSTAVRLAAAAAVSLLWFANAAVLSTWWRPRLDRLLTPRAAGR